MSDSVLPQWKQLLLERKKRKEQEREKREQEEEERLASMPAWKRGVIQRRMAKRECGGEMERDTGRELASGWRLQRNEIEKGKRKSDCEWTSKDESNERKDYRTERSDGGTQMGRAGERYAERGRKDGEGDVLPPLVCGVHTVKAENILIIQNRNNQENAEREIKERKKPGMRILSGGEKVICVSEVLIIKPSIKDERNKNGKEDEQKMTVKLNKGEEEWTECRKVQQLISKFGEKCRVSCRSQSSDCLIPGRNERKEERNYGCRTDGDFESQIEGRMNTTWNRVMDPRGEIFVPASVFYGMSENGVGDVIKQMERRSSWRAARTLTRVESLREDVEQRERERGRAEEGEKEEARTSKMENRQEVATPQSLSRFDVTREVSKEELPVCVPPSFSAERENYILKEHQDGVIQVAASKKEAEEDVPRESRIPLPRSSSSFSSPSAFLRFAQPAMSRIYNLKPVTSRAGVSVTDRNMEVQTHGGGTIKSRPGGSGAEVSSLRSVHRQVEQLRLKDPEVPKPINVHKNQTHVMSKPSSEPRVQTPLAQISASAAAESRNAKTEPTVTSPSTRLFTIRSACGGPAKRGNTITITPRKTGPSETPLSSDTTYKVPSSPITTPEAPSSTTEPSKKRYPTAEEIQVIGGYQNLERSCLVKKRGSPKTVKVCFDDSQLESQYMYPSEECVVKEEGNIDDWSRSEERKEENDEEEEDEDGAGSGIQRVLRVDESCPRLSLTPKLDSCSQNALRHKNMTVRDPQAALSRINSD